MAFPNRDPLNHFQNPANLAGALYYGARGYLAQRAARAYDEQARVDRSNYTPRSHQLTYGLLQPEHESKRRGYDWSSIRNSKPKSDDRGKNAPLIAQLKSEPSFNTSGFSRSFPGEYPNASEGGTFKEGRNNGIYNGQTFNQFKKTNAKMPGYGNQRRGGYRQGTGGFRRSAQYGANNRRYTIKPRRRTTLTAGRVQTSNRVPRPIYTKSSVFPTQFSTKLVTADIFRHVSTALDHDNYNQIVVCVLNSAIDPLKAPGSTQQPLYFDQLKAIYGKSVVVAAKITVQLLSIEAAAADELDIKFTSYIHRGDDTAVPTDQQACSSNTAQLAIGKGSLTSAGVPGNMLAFSRYASMSKFFGQDVQQSSGSYWEDGTTGVAPTTNECVYTIKYRNLSQVPVPVTTIINFRFQLEQWVVFGDKLKVADS